MIGLSAHIVNAGNLLTIHIPANTFMLIGWVVGVLIALLGRVFKTGPSKPFGVLSIVITCALIFILSLLYNPSSIVLSADKGTAEINTMMFFIPHHQTIPLLQIQGAMLATADGAEALRLVLIGGRTLQLTAYQATAGADEAASAINEFLRQHGGVGSPY